MENVINIGKCLKRFGRGGHLSESSGSNFGSWAQNGSVCMQGRRPYSCLCEERQNLPNHTKMSPVTRMNTIKTALPSL